MGKQKTEAFDIGAGKRGAGRPIVPRKPRPLGVRAKELGIQAKRLKRWDKIILDHVPNGLTQEEMAEAEDVSLSSIKSDFRDMRIKNFIK